MEDKVTLRKRILKIRDLQDPEVKRNKDDDIKRNMLSLIKERYIKTVLIFVSFRSEPDTYSVIEDCLANDISVAVPKVEGDDIRFYHISGAGDLKTGYMGIMEPADGCIPWEGHLETGETLVVVPGAVFDTDGYRIGYGGGYYDRFLKVYPGLYKAGICYDFQITDLIPRDSWDERVDCIVNNEEIINKGDRL